MAIGYSFDGLVRQVNTPLPPADFEMQLTHDVRVQRGKGSPVMVDVSAAGDGSVMRPVPHLYQGNFARASAATYWQNGKLYKAEINEPRFETDADGRPLGILIEGSSTNLTEYSENLNHDPSWGYNSHASNRILNAAISPDGSNTATRIQGSAEASTSTGCLAWKPVLVKGQIYTQSGWFKAGEAKIILLGSLFGDNNAYINIETGTVIKINTACISATARLYPSGWCYATATFAFADGIGNLNYYGGFTIRKDSISAQVNEGEGRCST